MPKSLLEQAKELLNQLEQDSSVLNKFQKDLYFETLKKAVIRGPWGGGPEKPGTVLHDEKQASKPSDIGPEFKMPTTDKYINTTRVHKSHGIGKVSGKQNDHYIMEIMDNNVPKKVLIHQDNIETNTRPVIDKKEAEKFKTFLKTPENIDYSHQTLNRSYKNMMDSMKSGNIYDTAKVWKSLINKHKSGESLNFSERMLLQLAHNQIHQELEASTGTGLLEEDFA